MLFHFQPEMYYPVVQLDRRAKFNVQIFYQIFLCQAQESRSVDLLLSYLISYAGTAGEPFHVGGNIFHGPAEGISFIIGHTVRTSVQYPAAGLPQFVGLFQPRTKIGYHR